MRFLCTSKSSTNRNISSDKCRPRIERHLEPLAVTANITQATHCQLDTVLLTFGFLVARYRVMDSPEDITGHTAISASFEKCWLAADRDIFIATVVANPLFRTTPFTRGVALDPQKVIPLSPFKLPSSPPLYEWMCKVLP